MSDAQELPPAAPPPGGDGTPSPEKGNTAPEESPSILPLLIVMGLILVGVVVGVSISDGPQAVEDPSAFARQLLVEGQKQQKLGDKLSLYHQAYQRAPEDPQVNAVLGQMLMHPQVNQFEEALPLLQFALENSEDAPPLLNLLLGKCLFGLERFEEAKGPLEKARKIAPQDPEPVRLLTLANLLNNDAPAAVSLLEEYLAIQPNHLPTLRWYSDLLDQVGRSDESIAALSSYTQLAPDDLSAHHSLEARRLRRDGFQEVLVQAEARTQAKRPSATDYYLWGRLLSRHPLQREKAAMAFEKAYEQDPALTWAILYLAHEYMKDPERLGEVRLKLEEVLVLDPSFAEAHFKLGQLARFQGRYEEARQRYTPLLGSARARVARAEIVSCWIAEGKPTEALDFLNEQLSGAPDDHPEWVLKVEALTAAGRFLEARQLLERLAASGQGLPWYWDAKLGRLSLEEGEHGRAQEDFTRALEALSQEEGRTPPDVLLWAGIAYLQGGDPERAGKLWEQAAETGREYLPEAIHTWSARRLLGRCEREVLEKAALLDWAPDRNDALYVEALKHELAGEREEALALYREASEASPPGDFPRRLCLLGIARLESE